MDFRIYRGSSTSHVASRDAVDPFRDEFLEMPSGLNANAATTSCCYTYVNGVTVKDLKPTGTATRAQVASIIMKFCQKNGL